MAVENINTYQGDAQLGQGTAGGVGPTGNYDMKFVNQAMDNLLQYNVLYKRDQWARNNLLVDQEAKDAASMLKFKIGDWTEKDRDAIMAEIKAMQGMYNSDPKRTRLRSDGSNSKQITEFAQQQNKIEAMIAGANTHKQQSLAIGQQYEQETDEDEKARILKHKEAEEQKDIGQDILLYANLKPFVAPKTPMTKAFTTYEWDPEKNFNTKKTVQIADIGAGTANINQIKLGTQGSAARKDISRGTTEFNDLVTGLRKQYGDLPEDELLAKILETQQGKDKMILLDRANEAIALNNFYAKDSGLPVLPKIEWYKKGLDENDMAKMYAASTADSKSYVEDITVTSIGINKDKLKNEVEQTKIMLRNAKTNEAELQFRKDQAKKGELSDEALIALKYGIMANVAAAPYRPGAVVDSQGYTEIPADQTFQDMFSTSFAPQDVEVKKGEAKKGEGEITTKTKADRTVITKVRVKGGQGGPRDWDNSSLLVTIYDPRTKQSQDVAVSKAQFDMAANRALGTDPKVVSMIATADARVKGGRGQNLPRYETIVGSLGDDLTDYPGGNLPGAQPQTQGQRQQYQFGPQGYQSNFNPSGPRTSGYGQWGTLRFQPQGQVGSSMNPIPVTYLPDGSIDNSKIIPGKHYYTKDGTIVQK